MKAKERIKYPTDEMRACGKIFSEDGSMSVSVGTHEAFRSADYNEKGTSAHSWKFMWHAEDGEPQVKKCIKCKYTLYLSQCGNRWYPYPSIASGGYLSVSPRFGGYAK